jgi:hypothetical protein
VANMEDVLALYQGPYDPRPPLVHMAAKPVQLIKETRAPWPAPPGQPSRDDDEYARVGTANVLLLTEPLPGWRTSEIAAQRTAVDGAHQITPLLDDGSPDADKVTLGCDHLHTHKIASLSEALEPPEARRLARRLEVPYTPKPGSWLNSAASALSVLTKPCLERRIPAIETLRQDTKAWEHERNAKQTGVAWQFTTADARIRLKRLYPQYQD